MSADRLPILKGLDGLVVVRPEVASLIAGPLRCWLREAQRRDRLPWPDAVWLLADALDRAAAAHRGREPGDVVVDVVAPTAADPDSAMVLDVTAAADLLHCTRQAVTARIRRGSLPASRDERGRWLIRIENLE